MDRKDQATCDQLKAMLHYDLEMIEVPERLQPDAIVASLKTADDSQQNDNLIRLCVIRLGGLRIGCEAFEERCGEAMERLRKLSSAERKRLGAPVLAEDAN